MISILDACDDPNLFKPWFKRPESYASWRVFLAALFGLPIDDTQMPVFREHTGRTVSATEPQPEAWLIIGRRGGKSFKMALISVYLACFFDYRQYLVPGERATILVIAADRRQARSIMNYMRGFFGNIPMLKKLVESETAESFSLSNMVNIEVGTASFRTTRGYTLAAVLADEIAFWRTDDAAEPDFAILDAVRPGMATIPNAMLLCASSPYARRGALWDAYKRYYGKDGAPLVWKASTRAMNPTVPQSVIDRAYERDAASASAEYGAEFRADIEAFISREVVEACVDAGVRERVYSRDATYRAFVDPSGGSNDSMTLAIGHREADRAVLDALREVKPPFSPEAVVQDFCALLKAWGVSEVTGDRYGGEWPRERFRVHGVSYELADHPRSDLYRDMLPMLNSRSAALLDNDRLVNQIVGLERRTGRGGKDSIDHGPNSHDDVANAVAGVFSLLREEASPSAMMFFTKRHRQAA